MSWLDLRDSPRATVTLLASETTGGKYFNSLVYNLSTNGAYLELPMGMQRPSSHDTVLELILPGVPKLIWARCRILRDEPKGFFMGRAIKFLNISAVDRSYIRRYIHGCFACA